jgi:hypothetical protein
MIADSRYIIDNLYIFIVYHTGRTVVPTFDTPYILMCPVKKSAVFTRFSLFLALKTVGFFCVFRGFFPNASRHIKLITYCSCRRFPVGIMTPSVISIEIITPTMPDAPVI